MSGRLHIEISRLSGTLPDRNQQPEVESNDSFEMADDESGVAIGSTIVCQVRTHLLYYF